MTTRVLVIAGTASGVGKTTVTLGLLEAYRRRGLVVAAFKVGGDFIDPGRARGHEFHHSTLDAVPERVARVWRHDGGGAEAYLIHRALLSYVHLHFASNPELPRAFVAACADAR